MLPRTLRLFGGADRTAVALSTHLEIPVPNESTLMRKTSTKNGVTVKAYAGVTGVLVAMNVATARRAGLLGFALKRRG